MCRIPGVYGIRRHILGDHRSGTDNASVTDGNPGDDRHVRSDPAVLSDSYRESSHLVAPPFDVITGVVRCNKMASGTDLGVMPYSYRGSIEECAVIIHNDILSDTDVES